MIASTSVFSHLQPLQNESGQARRDVSSLSLKKVSFAGSLALVLTWGSESFAQSDDARAERSILDEVTVTAERRAESSQRVPISMSVFSRDFITEYIRDVLDVAAFTPNLQVSTGNGFRASDAGAIRGIGLEERATSVSSHSILTYYDDIAVGTPFAAGIPQWDLERVEVLRGPQGTLYGRNALAGAIKYISAAPTDELSGYANLTVGEHHLRQFEGGVSGPITPTVKARISGVVHDRAGNVTSITTNSKLGERSWLGVRGIVDWQPTDKFDARIKVQYWEGDQDNLFYNAAPSSLFDPILRQQFAAEGTNVDLDWQSDYEKINSPLRDPFEELDLTLGQLDLNYDFGPVRLTAVSSYMQGESTALFDFRNRKPAVQILAIGADEPVSMRQWSEEVRLTSQTDHPLQWIAGAYYQQTDDSLGTLAVSIGPLVPSLILPGTTVGSFSSMDSIGSLKTYAVFAHTTYNWSERLKTTHALRYTKEDRTSDFGLSTLLNYPITPGAVAGSIQAEGYDLLNFARLSYAEQRAQAVRIISDPNTRDANGNPVPTRLADSWDEMTWRLAADYQFGDQALLYSSISTGFKGGTFAQNAVGGARAGVGPESSLVYEIGTKTQWLDNRLQVNAAVFYNDHSDLQANQFVSEIDPVTGQLVGFFRIENLPKTKISGAELTVRVVPIENLSILAQLGVLDSEITEALPGNETIEGNELPLVADKNYSAHVRYDVRTGLGTFSPGLSGSYVGKFWSSKDNDDLTGQLGDYWLAEARLNYTSPSGRVSGWFYVRNLFDTVEPTWSNTARPDTTTGTTSSRVNEHRNWGITMSYRF